MQFFSEIIGLLTETYGRLVAAILSQTDSLHCWLYREVR